MLPVSVRAGFEMMAQNWPPMNLMILHMLDKVT